MQEKLKKENRLINLIKDSLSDEEKKIITLLDFEKTDEEIIHDLIKANILNFGSSRDNDKESH